IITSHHPYIINNIKMEHWKIVTRKGGIVTAQDAKDFNLGKSRHQAFMQLINLSDYKEGIKVG
ncbi:MAG: ATP-binding protein, partial [Rhizonema sp. PD37]|nr:ATP-binding protein [Rhizonema sp. PD37]